MPFWCSFVTPMANLLYRKRNGEEWGPWTMPLGHLPGACAIIWPYTVERNAEDSSSTYGFGPPPQNLHALYTAVVDETVWAAMPVKWKSPFSRCVDAVAVGDRDMVKHYSIRGKPSGPAGPLLIVHARQCFKGMKRVWLNRLCKHLGVAGTGLTLLQVLELLIRTILLPVDGVLTEEQVLGILRLELVSKLDEENFTMECFMNVEGSHLDFLPQDREVFTQSRNKYKLRMEEKEDFVVEYHKKLKVVNAAAKAAAE